MISCSQVILFIKTGLENWQCYSKNHNQLTILTNIVRTLIRINLSPLDIQKQRGGKKKNIIKS